MTVEAVECIGAWYAIESSCGCPHHVEGARRTQKLRRHGYLPPDPSDLAWAALDRMLAAGRTVTEIAATSGLDQDCLWATIRQRRVRGQRRISRARAEAIIAAESKQPAGGMVDAAGSRRRLQALAAIGWSARALSERCSVGEPTLCVIRSGVVTRTKAAHDTAIRKMYDVLSGTPGTSASSRRWAARNRWAPPCSWDDIDDPTERPKGLGGTPHRKTTSS